MLRTLAEGLASSETKRSTKKKYNTGLCTRRLKRKEHICT